MENSPSEPSKIVVFPGHFAGMTPGRRYALHASIASRINPLALSPRHVQRRLKLKRGTPEELTLDQRIACKEKDIAEHQGWLAKTTDRQNRERLQKRIAQREAELEALKVERREHREQAELLLPEERSAAS